MKEISFEARISAPVIYDYLLKHTYSGSMGVIGSTMGALLLVVAYLQKSWLYVAAGILVLAYIPVAHYLTAQKQARMNPAFQNPLIYSLTETGISVRSGDSQVDLAWENVTKAVSTKTSLLIYSSPSSAWILPRKDMGEDLGSVLEMLGKHLPPAVNRIRY